MNSIKIRTVVFGLLILLIALSGYLTFSYASGKTEGVCIISEHGGCSDVQNSVYGEFLGVRVCHWGLIAFSILFLIYLFAEFSKKNKRKALKAFVFLSGIGGLIALYFIFVQFFILKTLCSTCLVVDTSVILVFLLAYFESNGRR